MTEAAPAAAGATVEKKRTLLRRFPTSLIVTLVGIVVTAWLLPAFTRQWDDRQKAQELKSALVADMASASARALTGGEPIWSGGRADSKRVLSDWGASSLRIETRVRAYLGPELVTAWQIYTWLVNRWNNGQSGEAEAALRAAVYALGPGLTPFSRFDRSGAPPVRLGKKMTDAIALVFVVGDGQNSMGLAPRFQGGLYVETLLVGRLRTHFPRPKELPLYRSQWPTAEWALVRLQAVIADEVLHSHVNGYSTTSRDLIHDLIPA